MAAPSARATPGTLRAWRDWRLAVAVALRALPAALRPVARVASAAPVLVTSKLCSPLTSARTTASVSLGSSFVMRASIFSSSARIEAASWAVSVSPTTRASRSIAV